MMNTTGPMTDAQRASLEATARVLAAFPWSRKLSPEERARFTEELSHHGSDMTNAQLEALLVGWRQRADHADRSRSRSRYAA